MSPPVTCREPSDRLHVLELVRGLDKGGRTVRILEESRCLQDLGFRVTVASLDAPARWVRERWPEVENFVVWGTRGEAGLRGLLGLCQLIRRLRVDVVHAHSEDGYLYGGLAATATRVPALGTFHRSRIEFYRRDLKTRIWNRLLRKQVAVSTNRRDLMVRLSGVPADRIAVVHGGVDSKRFPFAGPEARAAARRRLGLSLDTPLLLGIGHLGLIKGHDIAIQALPDILREFPATQLYLAGDGEPEELAALQRLVAGKSLGDRVAFLGQINNPAEWLAASDLFVQVPRDEAFGLVFAEAASVGRPVVASRVGGIPEIVMPNETGLLVEPEDIDGVSRAVKDLLRQPAEIERMGIDARRRAEMHFSAEAVARSYAAMMLKLVPSEKARQHAAQVTEIKPEKKQVDYSGPRVSPGA